MLLLAVCATSQTFAGVGSAAGETGSYKYAVFPTNTGESVLLGDWNKHRVVVYSAQDLSYQQEWAISAVLHKQRVALPKHLVQAAISLL
jgi:hypothetical protein